MPRRRPGPSVKDPEQYEALRDDGMSKEKAARIANASANEGRLLLAHPVVAQRLVLLGVLDRRSWPSLG
ncbi:MAG TPA: hypothetical protein VM262_00305, partial [Acidimicrobiales bacterium]|nr:hypothetical protein [Acidimicrobiales bacterium]